MAMVIFANNLSTEILPENESYALELYKKGIKSENDQLPCFLPYESNKREALQNIFDSSFFAVNSGKADSTDKIQDTQSNKELKRITRESIRKDYRRIQLIVDHRIYLTALNNALKTDRPKSSPAFTPSKKQTVDSIIGLKPIYIKDIDFTRDYILKGYVLKLKTIDIPIIPPALTLALRLVAEDEFGFAERIAIYNLSRDNIKHLEESYKIGVQFCIISPYIRQALDNRPMLRVDDPKSIIFVDEIKQDICRFCGKDDSKFSCSKCKVAKYCSKECQIDDWKILNHKIICDCY